LRDGVVIVNKIEGILPRPVSSIVVTTATQLRREKEGGGGRGRREREEGEDNESTMQFVFLSNFLTLLV
jgi:hypothetical protein